MNKHPPSNNRRRQHGGTLLGLAFGLVVGVLISFGVVWYLNKTPLPFVDKVTTQEPKQSGTKPDGGPLALPGKPGDKPIDKAGERKFEFYEILEGKKDAKPQGAVPPPPPLAASPSPPPTDTLGSGKLFLQAGAFQKAADAENLRARLAILGFEAAVLEAEVPEKGTMHRVRVGPYASADEMNRVRGQLSQNGIPATVVRVKD